MKARLSEKLLKVLTISGSSLAPQKLARVRWHGYTSAYCPIILIARGAFWDNQRNYYNRLSNSVLDEASDNILLCLRKKTHLLFLRKYVFLKNTNLLPTTSSIFNDEMLIRNLKIGTWYVRYLIHSGHDANISLIYKRVSCKKSSIFAAYYNGPQETVKNSFPF